ncbi:phosphatase PAP2 family protein [Kineococcus gynurae]|uniref:Phosphatase PAP2 family protein n=1 Tax=Kineococcus gynurae TaxID=452979 RepID=A0ABV5LSJ4_9ACTN
MTASSTAPGGYRAARPRTAGYLLAAVVQALAFAVLFVVCVLTRPGQLAEDVLHGEAYRRAAEGGDSPQWLSFATTLVEGLQPWHFVIGLGVLAVVGLLRRRLRLTLAALATALGTMGLAELLKHVLLERPDLAGTAGAAATNSLPSGHTSAALGIGLGLVLLAPGRWRAPAAVVAAVAAGSMGAMVVEHGWHRLSDVLASALLASFVATVTAVLPVGSGRTRRVAAPPGAVLQAAVLVPALAAGALLLVYALPTGTLPVSALDLSAASGGLVAAATVLLVARALPREARRD